MILGISLRQIHPDARGNILYVTTTEDDCIRPLTDTSTDLSGPFNGPLRNAQARKGLCQTARLSA